ncbi:hypothetical protein SAMN05444167_0747 [Terriglobus roseus]|uniref:Uncharacterized protein n=2 Tax=Terriglobus roseus TaxID=392734 RepID=A0A1G7GMX9_9BACT|nr:hypothetical protein SAMN05444167_0747 [Terriglobus roseus]
MFACRAWICSLILVLVMPFNRAETGPIWRAASSSELEAFLPARAPVDKEHIETELRTATGITDGHGRTVAAVVLITAGYAAEGRYSHYLLTQTTLRVGDTLVLKPGAYVMGWTRVAEGLNVHVYDAQTGAELGAVLAHPYATKVRVEPIHIWPPAENSLIQIGRYYLTYHLSEG